MSAPETSFFGRLTTVLLRRRALVFLVTLAITAVAGTRMGMTYAGLRSNLEDLLPANAPSVASLDAARERLPGLRHLGIVVDTGGAENVPAARRFLDDLASKIRAYPPGLVTAVRADVVAERRFAETYALQMMDPGDVKTLREAVERRRDWEVSRALGTDFDDEPAPPIPIETLRTKYEARYGKGPSFPDDRFVSKDGHTAVLLVQVASLTAGKASDGVLLSRVQSDVQALGFPGAYAANMRVGYAGDVATAVEELEGLYTDLSLSGALVLLAVVALLVWYFRAASSLVILSVPIFAGIAATFGIAALPPLSIRHLNTNTAFLGSIIIGNGLNSGVILLARFQEERRRGVDPTQAASVAVTSTWRPTLAAAFAAAVAYGSLILTDFRGFNQFGWIGGIGMILCWVATYTVAPPLMASLGAGIGRTTGVRSRASEIVASIALRMPRLVVAITAVALVLSCAGVWHRSADWVELDFSKLRRRDSAATGERYWGKRMNDTLGRYLTPTVIMARDAEQARRVEGRVRALVAEGRAGGLIGEVRTAQSLLPATREASLEEAKLLAKALTPRLRSMLPEKDRALVERALGPDALRPLDLAAVPDVLAAGLRERDGRADRNVLVFPKLGAGTWDANRMEGFTRDLRAAASEDGAPALIAGSMLLSTDIIAAMKSDGPRATLISLGLVLLIAIVAFRSVRLSAAAVGSLLVGVTLMLGALAWAGERFNFSNFVALPITFGIAADYAVNVLARYQADGRGDLRAALASTGGAVAMCSATTIIGYGSLLVAQNRALFSFGVCAVAGELTCLATALIALPALLSLLLRRPSAPAGDDPPRLQPTT
ncbi:RND superfamily protein [Minicystis rosea]|nr:RND superfamily protein [Minicystis rosea]